MWKALIRKYHIIDIIVEPSGIKCVWEFGKPTLFTYDWLRRSSTLHKKNIFWPNFRVDGILFDREKQIIKIIWEDAAAFDFPSKYLYHLSHGKSFFPPLERLPFQGVSHFDEQFLKKGSGSTFDKQKIDTILVEIQRKGGAIIQFEGPKIEEKQVEEVAKELFVQVYSGCFVRDEFFHNEGCFMEQVPSVLAITQANTGVGVIDGVRVHSQLKGSETYEYLKNTKVPYRLKTDNFMFYGEHPHLGENGEINYSRESREVMLCGNEYFAHIDRLEQAMDMSRFWIPLDMTQLLLLDNKRMLHQGGGCIFGVPSYVYSARLNNARFKEVKQDEYLKDRDEKIILN
ncbi:unnamed protein product [Blepharisma stoltei]|uniref:TauD/TfdA-like domain-containing protein n=1 Tax=Blepharisma stoltei TaxID=1481888 RepID=A0AAU9J2R3_9CILI|nr:unnamed protein product [Blepharisma stoltei]